MPAQPDLEGPKHGSKEEGEKLVDRLSAKTPHDLHVWGPVLGNVEPDALHNLNLNPSLMRYEPSKAFMFG